MNPYAVVFGALFVYGWVTDEKNSNIDLERTEFDAGDNMRNLVIAGSVAATVWGVARIVRG